MKTSTLLPFVLPFLAPLLGAQTPPHLVGLTRTTQSLRHVSHAPCAVLNQCPVMLPLPILLPPHAGGTAWDPTRPGAWVTNGLALTKVADNCNVLCPPAPIPSLGIGAVVTGMEYVENFNQLWLIDDQGMLHFYANACPPVPLGICNTGLAPSMLGNVTSGLAVDDVNGLVFIAYPVFPAGPNRIVVSLLNAPCTPVTQFILPGCAFGFGAVTGLACDWGNQVLYATDGLTTLAMPYGVIPPATIVPGPVTCCPSTVVADPMVGLAIRPGGASSVGAPCANGTCLPCPQVLSLRNDPCLGNAQFTIGLDQAPDNALAILGIGSTPCISPGITLPFLCGPLYVWPVLGTLGPNPTGGVGICDGTTNFTIPLPIAPGLAGLVFSSQAVTLCLTGAGGWGMSNCLSWELQGN